MSPTAKESTSCHLYVEVSKFQRKLIEVTQILALTECETTKYVSIKDGSMRLADRKIVRLDTIKPYYGLVNDKQADKMDEPSLDE